MSALDQTNDSESTESKTGFDSASVLGRRSRARLCRPLLLLRIEVRRGRGEEHGSGRQRVALHCVGRVEPKPATPPPGSTRPGPWAGPPCPARPTVTCRPDGPGPVGRRAGAAGPAGGPRDGLPSQAICAGVQPGRRGDRRRHKAGVAPEWPAVSAIRGAARGLQRGPKPAGPGPRRSRRFGPCGTPASGRRARAEAEGARCTGQALPGAEGQARIRAWPMSWLRQTAALLGTPRRACRRASKSGARAATPRASPRLDVEQQQRAAGAGTRTHPQNRCKIETI
jgi:hypothetical protein